MPLFSSSSSSLPFFLLLLIIFSDSVDRTRSLGVGINYGQIADNLPSPSQVSILLRSLNISRVKLYDADPIVLQAFANTNVDFIVSIGNEYLANMAQDPSKALTWIQQRVLPYYPATRITCITVGNEVLSGSDTQVMPFLYPAMDTVYQALVTLGLHEQIVVTTAHMLTVLAASYPPSSGVFREDISQYMRQILNFHSQTKSPFLINAYPFFAYKGNPGEVSLEYALFEPNQGFIDPNTNLKYDNMLYAQIDAVYAAIKVMGHTDIEVRVSETGWPSMGGSDEVGATPNNARLYNGNLLKRIEEKQGTPSKPTLPIDIHIFALFNENQKPGPVSERNYGLYYPNGVPVYNIGLQGTLPGTTIRPSSSSSSTKIVSNIFDILIIFTACLILARLSS